MASVNTRMLPANGAGGTVTGWAGPGDIGGIGSRRYYSASGGQTIDALGSPQDGDANVLVQSGFIPICASGSTSLRNSLTPGGWFKTGALFLDTTIGLIVVWDGLSWRNPVNGNAV
jgi:hypothetical protein